MSQAKPITIVGGGLAGLTLGIGLRQRGIPVTIWEASHYPRHRVCGEFVSGRGQEVLERLGLLDMFKQAGAIFSSTTRFFLDGWPSPLRAIEPPALCLSRFTMDQMLASHFCELGGELHQNARYDQPHGGEGYVFASGRAAKPTVKGWRWFGLKVHARNVALEADLEMHTAFNGYVGLCRLPAGEINICGLFRARPGASGPAPEQLLAGIPGTLLNQRLARAQYDRGSFCSVAGLCLRGQSALQGSDCRLGDALTMIPPVTGNGMSMAFESAGIALPFFDAYCRGEMPWESAWQTVARQCDAAFRQRLFWAKWIQYVMLHPLSRRTVGPLLLNCDLLWDHFFSRTR
jgi:flavin-dependent dehydrogenase